ncbi:MAG: T9SS type A sorting domain-containing protein [Bacteroidales bacterium]|nr:T9SS type A sorting domain-containing protein [Bacteroidales bacterium]
MKKIILFVPALLLGILSFSQSWEWVRTSLSENTEYSDNICVDNSGNIFVMGQSSNEIIFGTTTLNSTNERFGYLVKYNPNGDVLWAKKIIDSDDADYELMSLVADANGNVAVVGHFGDTQTILDEEFTSTVSGYWDSFIFKLNSAGEKQWIRTGGGNNSDNAYDVVSDNAGNFYVATDFVAEATYGAFSVTAESVNFSNSILIIKYLSDGTVDWVSQAGGLSFDYPTGIAFDGTKLFITGHMSSGDAVFGDYNAHFDGITCGFFAQLDPADGIFDWVNVIDANVTVTGLIKEENFHIVVDDNAIYITGSYYESANFGESINFNNEGENGFMVSYTKSGDLNWAYEIITESGGIPCSISISDGNVYAVGNYVTSVTINENELVGTPPGGMFPYLSNAYIYSFSSTGEVNWAKSIDAYYAASYDAGSAIINGVASFGDYIYTSGDFTKTIEFSPFEVTSHSSVDVFLAKIDVLGNSAESISSDLEVNVYPNPVSDFLNVKFESHEDQFLGLVDISGKEIVKICHKSNGVEQIDMSSLKAGLYILTISSDKGNHSIRIVKN